MTHMHRRVIRLTETPAADRETYDPLLVLKRPPRREAIGRQASRLAVLPRSSRILPIRGSCCSHCDSMYRSHESHVHVPMHPITVSLIRETGLHPAASLFNLVHPWEWNSFPFSCQTDTLSLSTRIARATNPPSQTRICISSLLSSLLLSCSPFLVSSSLSRSFVCRAASALL